MKVERTKYVIWAADISRALAFYRDALDATVTRRSDLISEIEVAGATIGIHGGGTGRRTWTGMSFQVADVVEGAGEVVAAGGKRRRLRVGSAGSSRSCGRASAIAAAALRNP